MLVAVWELSRTIDLFTYQGNINNNKICSTKKNVRHFTKCSIDASHVCTCSEIQIWRRRILIHAYAGLMLGQRLRRWPNIELAWVVKSERVVIHEHFASYIKLHLVTFIFQIIIRFIDYFQSDHPITPDV